MQKQSSDYIRQIRDPITGKRFCDFEYNKKNDMCYLNLKIKKSILKIPWDYISSQVEHFKREIHTSAKI